MPGLHFVPWHRGSGCLGAAAPTMLLRNQHYKVQSTKAPVTGAAADEHNLNVVDCDASATVPRLSSIPVLKWGSGGYPHPPEADVKDNGFPWPPPGLLGIFLLEQGTEAICGGPGLGQVKVRRSESRSAWQREPERERTFIRNNSP